MLLCLHLTLTKVSVYKPYILDEIELLGNTSLFVGSPLILSPMDLSIAAMHMKGK